MVQEASISGEAVGEWRMMKRLVRQMGLVSPRWSMRQFWSIALAATIACAAVAHGQSSPDRPMYSRANTFGFLAAYSNDSSHILMGIAVNRKLLNFGATYRRRLLENDVVNWQYSAEVLPVALESDPVETQVTTVTPSSPPITFRSSYSPIGACRAGSGSYQLTIEGVTYNYHYVDTCSRQWTIGEGMSPVGFQWNFMPRRKLQPILLAHGGYMYSTHPIPTGAAGSFNFTFDFGLGVELYQTKTRSLKLDYRFHHISDRATTDVNPGIDNGLFTLTYSFGR